MKNLSLLIALCFTLGFAGCNTAEKYALNNQAGQQWLARHSNSASFSVTGQWNSDDWGGASLKQSGRTITGTLGRYEAKGVTSGRRVYLLLSDGGWIYYTAVLAPANDGLEGFYSYTVPFDVADQREMRLVRIRE